jgi:hypothetical protein
MLCVLIKIEKIMPWESISSFHYNSIGENRTHKIPIPIDI